MYKVDKKVIDWVDKVVEKEHYKNSSAKSRFEFGRIDALNRVNERLNNMFINLPIKEGQKVKKGSKVEFVLNAMSYTDDLRHLFEDSWGYKGCLSDRYNDCLLSEELALKKRELKMVDKKVIDWLDKVVCKEQQESLFNGRCKSGDIVYSLNRVRERLGKAVDKMPKDTNVAKGTKAEFVISARRAADDLANYFRQDWNCGNVIKRKSYECFNVVKED